MKHLNIKDQAQALEAEVSSITVDSGYDSTDVEVTIRQAIFFVILFQPLKAHRWAILLFLLDVSGGSVRDYIMQAFFTDFGPTPTDFNCSQNLIFVNESTKISVPIIVM